MPRAGFQDSGHGLCGGRVFWRAEPLSQHPGEGRTHSPQGPGAGATGAGPQPQLATRSSQPLPLPDASRFSKESWNLRSMWGCHCEGSLGGWSGW